MCNMSHSYYSMWGPKKWKKTIFVRIDCTAKRLPRKTAATHCNTLQQLQRPCHSEIPEIHCIALQHATQHCCTVRCSAFAPCLASKQSHVILVWMCWFFLLIPRPHSELFRAKSKRERQMWFCTKDLKKCGIW